MRIASVAAWESADVVVKNGVWASNRCLFGKWVRGETLVLLVGKEALVVATVIGTWFRSDNVLWKDDLYEYRIPVHIERIVDDNSGVTANQAVRRCLAAGLGNVYGTYIMSQSRLPKGVEELVRSVL